MTQTAPSSAFKLNGWHVLAGMVAFFGVTLAVDAVMITEAYRTYPGEASATPFQEGLAFDTELAQQRAQSALGWRMSVGLAPGGVIRLSASDAKGAPISDLRLDARLERPATEAGRRALAFHPTAPGIYEAGAPALTGAWDLRLSARDTRGRRFDAERRLVVP
jgi:nitrogen fixation protein FixH